jgi:hypothetical protein
MIGHQGVDTSMTVHNESNTASPPSFGSESDYQSSAAAKSDNSSSDV